jgi:hypothetical protein
MKALKHSEDCYHRYEHQGCDVTGVKYCSCFGCGAFEHEPIVFGKVLYIGHLSRWPDPQRTPYGHESGLLDFPNCYSLDYTFSRPIENRLPVIKTPIPIAFQPTEVIAKDDAKQHEGVSFREVWTDPIARIIWLGHKPFMLTNQYFRGYCIGHADDLRKNPGRLLGERVSFHFDGGFSMDYDFFGALGSQLVPYLIRALDAEGFWPYFRIPGKLLEWEYRPERRAA